MIVKIFKTSVIIFLLRRLNKSTTKSDSVLLLGQNFSENFKKTDKIFKKQNINFVISTN